MNRRNFFTAAMALGLAVISRKAEAAPAQIKAPRPTILTRYEGPDVVNIEVANLPPISGVYQSERPYRPDRVPDGSLWCQCPACLGSGFRAEEHNICGYCNMAGKLTTTETFAMYNGEGNAEVWRSLVWHEWSQRNWKESVDGPQPWLPGMLCYIGEKHPEVYDTATHSKIFQWLEKRFDEAHAKSQIEAWTKEENLKRSREIAEKVIANPGTMVACDLFKPFPPTRPYGKPDHIGYRDMGGNFRLIWTGRDGVQQHSSGEDWTFTSVEEAKAEAATCRALFPCLEISVEGRIGRTA